MSEIGDLLRKLRGSQSLRKASEKIGISHTYLDTIEKGYDKRSGKPVKPTPETLKLIAKAYDYSYKKLMQLAGYIDETESKEHDDLPELTSKDEKEIAKDLERIINSLDHADGMASFGGSTIDDMDPEDLKLLKNSLESSLIIAKRMAKKKFTPKKYRKEDD